MSTLKLTKVFPVLIWLCISAMPALAQNNSNQGQNGDNQGQNGNNQGQSLRGAPAPLIGIGLPTFLTIGGVLLGVKLLKRNR